MTAEKTKRKLIAVVHADVKGYSRMMGEDDEYTVRTLASNRQEMYRLAQMNDGQVVDTAGDGFLIEFHSVVDAVKFSVEFQREMKGRNADLPTERKMEFRIGVNIGDVIHDGGTIHGDGVNVAARLEGLADPGGICISGAAYEQVKKKLDVDFEFLGKKSVKNISEPVPAFGVLIDSCGAAPRGLGFSWSGGAPWRKTYWAAAAVIVALIASAAIWYAYSHPISHPDKAVSEDVPEPALPDKPSIAVLPFDNMSGDPKQDYFSDGITEEIITGLSKMPRLFVVARNSSFAFRGRPVDVKEVGRKLGVRYVLEGSIRKERNRVRITAQLIDAQTGGHVWSERYDRELKDIFAVQDEVTLSVIRAMRVQLTDGEQAALWEKKGLTDNLQAFEKYLQGRQYSIQCTEGANAKARQLYQEAIDLDPGFGMAYAKLAAVHVIDAWFGWSKDPRESGRKAYELAQKALSIDDSLDTPHYMLGMIYVYMGQHDKALAEGERAVELNPGGHEALAFMAMFLNWAGRPAEASKLLDKAMRLNPMPPALYYWISGVSYRLMHQYDKAITQYEKGLQIQQDQSFCLLGLAATYGLTDRADDARKAAAEFLRNNPRSSLKRFAQNSPYKDPRETKRLIDALRKAGLK